MTSRYSGWTVRAMTARVAAGDADGHHHGLGCAGGAVVHAGVGDLHAGEFADHGLELEHGLERALRDLGLVGRVAGEELAALDERVDDDGLVVAIDAGAEEAGVAGGVGFGEGAEAVDDLGLGVLARDGEVARELVLGGDGGEEVVDGVDAGLVSPMAASISSRSGGIWADSAWLVSGLLGDEFFVVLGGEERVELGGVLECRA